MCKHTGGYHAHDMENGLVFHWILGYLLQPYPDIAIWILF
jgi:hypothetical protein